MKKVLFRLQSYYKYQATDVEKPVIRYILDNPRDVTSMDIHSLAKIGYCSAPTIVRICQKNGFKGFKDVKLAIINDLTLNEEIFRDRYIEFEGNTINKIVQLVLNKNVNAITNTYNLVDFEELKKIIEKMKATQVIRLFGIGASFLVCKDFQQKLERINKFSVLYEDTHMQLINAKNIKSDELAFIISYSGQTQEILKMANIIKSNGATIIAITRYDHNKLMNLADHNLFVPSIEEIHRIGAGSSRISQFSIIDILYNIYIEDTKEKSTDNILETGKLLKKDEEIN